MTTTFLDTLTFLSDDQRRVLAENDLDTPEAFRHITLERLEREPFKLSPGRASKLLLATGGGAASSNTTNILQVAEPPDVETKIDRALLAAHDDPRKAGALLDLGVDALVLGADDRIDVAATKALRAHLAGGARLPATWQGQRIAATRELSTPPVWNNPKQGGLPLQAGKDEISGVPWGELKIDGLRAAAFGYRQGMFDGMTEAAVFAALSDPHGNTLGRVIARMAAMKVKPEDMDVHVVMADPVGRAWTPPGGPLRNGAGLDLGCRAPFQCGPAPAPAQPVHGRRDAAVLPPSAGRRGPRWAPARRDGVAGGSRGWRRRNVAQSRTHQRAPEAGAHPRPAPAVAGHRGRVQRRGTVGPAGPGRRQRRGSGSAQAPGQQPLVDRA